MVKQIAIVVLKIAVGLVLTKVIVYAVPIVLIELGGPIGGWGK